MQIVVGAAIVRRGLLLSARRSAPAALAGGWELPGGKVEPGETELAALVRECREELGVVVTPGTRVPGEWPLGPRRLLRVYLAEIVTGEPAPLEDHDELRWLGTADLFAVPWLPADVPAVVAVQAVAQLA